MRKILSKDVILASSQDLSRYIAESMNIQIAETSGFTETRRIFMTFTDMVLIVHYLKRKTFQSAELIVSFLIMASYFYVFFYQSVMNYSFNTYIGYIRSDLQQKKDQYTQEERN